MNYSKDIEDVYYDECHHLHCCDIKSSDCLKRYFIVYDINTHSRKRIIVCNEFVRLLFNMHSRFIEYKSYNSKDYIYSTIIEKHIISKVLKYDDRYTNMNEGFFNYYVCDRPTIFGLSNIFDVSLALSDKDFYIDYFFYDRFFDALKFYCNEKLRYKKYKSQHEKINSILKKVQKQYFSKELLSELFIEILTLKIDKQ